MDDFKVYCDGFEVCCVCSKLPPEEIARRLNDKDRKIDGYHWVFENDTATDGGESFCASLMKRKGASCPCPQASKTHRHYIFRFVRSGAADGPGGPAEG